MKDTIPEGVSLFFVFIRDILCFTGFSLFTELNFCHEGYLIQANQNINTCTDMSNKIIPNLFYQGLNQWQVHIIQLRGGYSKEKDDHSRGSFCHCSFLRCLLESPSHFRGCLIAALEYTFYFNLIPSMVTSFLYLLLKTFDFVISLKFVSSH